MLVNLREVAERLGCSLANVYSLKDRGLLHVVSVGAGGKGFRVTDEEVQRFLRDRREHPGRDAPPFPKKASPRLFKQLNGDRLREAWKKQGVE